MIALPLAKCSSHFTRFPARAVQSFGVNRAKSLSCGCRVFAGRSMDYTDCGIMCHLQRELLTSGDQALEDQRGIVLPLDCLQTLHVFGTIRRQHLLIVVGVVHHSATVSLCKRKKCRSLSAYMYGNRIPKTFARTCRERTNVSHAGKTSSLSAALLKVTPR